MEVINVLWTKTFAVCQCLAYLKSYTSGNVMCSSKVVLKTEKELILNFVIHTTEETMRTIFVKSHGRERKVLIKSTLGVNLFSWACMMYVCAHTCEGQRSTSVIILSHFVPYNLRQHS